MNLNDYEHNRKSMNISNTVKLTAEAKLQEVLEEKKKLPYYFNTMYR